MSWKESGADRVKRFEVYKALEADYRRTLHELNTLKATYEAEIEAKDATIRSLARALAEIGGSLIRGSIPAPNDLVESEATLTSPEVQNAVQRSPGPSKGRSGTMPKVLPKDIPLKDVIGGKQK